MPLDSGGFVEYTTKTPEKLKRNHAQPQFFSIFRIPDGTERFRNQIRLIVFSNAKNGGGSVGNQDKLRSAHIGRY